MLSVDCAMDPLLDRIEWEPGVPLILHGQLGAARLDSPGIDAAPVSRLLSPSGLILLALCRAFLSLAPRLSLGSAAGRIRHARGPAVLTLAGTGVFLTGLGSDLVLVHNSLYKSSNIKIQLLHPLFN